MRKENHEIPIATPVAPRMICDEYQRDFAVTGWFDTGCCDIGGAATPVQPEEPDELGGIPQILLPNSDTTHHHIVGFGWTGRFAPDSGLDPAKTQHQ